MSTRPESDKLDLYKAHKTEYAVKREPALFEIGPAQYLAIEGAGHPEEGEAFQESIAALYGAAFTIKMTRKAAGLGDYKVCALEGLWWGKRPDFYNDPKSEWSWKLLIRTPEFVGAADLAAAAAALLKKGKGEAVRRVRLETIKEGPCIQAMHIGPYATECETIAAMAAFAEREGLTFHGLHHEIYLGDPRRTAPEKLKTILRLPVKG